MHPLFLFILCFSIPHPFSPFFLPLDLGITTLIFSSKSLNKEERTAYHLQPFFLPHYELNFAPIIDGEKENELVFFGRKMAQA